MRKRLLSFIIIIPCFLLFLSTAVYARTYSTTGMDLSISIDDTRWYVFTRDNILDNPQLAEWDLSYSDIYNFFQNNNVYIDAVLPYESGTYTELFVRQKSVENVGTLSNYDQDTLLSLAAEMASLQGADKYNLYRASFPFVRLEYTSAGYYLCEYITVVNNKNYTLTFQSPSPFTNTELLELEDIVDTVRIATEQPSNPPSKTELPDVSLEMLAVGAIIVGITGMLAFLLITKKKSKSPIESQNHSAHKVNKDRRHIKKIFAIALFSVQAMSLAGAVMNGEIDKILSNNAAYLIGFFSPSIIATILLIFVRKETLRIQKAEDLDLAEVPPSPESAASTVHFCGKCGQLVATGSQFCPQCGNKIAN